jgi:hypothetical protein
MPVDARSSIVGAARSVSHRPATTAAEAGHVEQQRKCGAHAGTDAKRALQAVRSAPLSCCFLCGVNRRQRMRRTSFSQQLDLLDWGRATSVTLPNEAVLALSEQLCQLLVELTDRQSPLNDPNQEASE